MKKDVIAVILMVVAVVIGVGIRYYIQNGSLAPKEQETEPVMELMQENGTSGETPEEVTKEPMQIEPDNDWGVVLSAEDVTADGMTLVCLQSGGNSTGELLTGPWYEIEVFEDGQWKTAPVYAEVCWEDIAWAIPAEDTTQWEVNWTWIYGTLPAGEYRIVKEIMDFRQTGDFDTCRSYAHFTIE